MNVKGDIDPDFIGTAISNDQLWSIPFKYSWLDFKDDELPEDVREVFSIMAMWRFIEDSYSNLSDINKSEVSRRADPFGDNPKFNGFDGNNEMDQLCIAECIIEELNRFNEFKDRHLNSHEPSLDGYRRMLRVFNTLQHRRNGNVEDLVNILRERIHPSNRD